MVCRKLFNSNTANNLELKSESDLLAKLGDVDEDLFYELGMVLVDRLELK